MLRISRRLLTMAAVAATVAAPASALASPAFIYYEGHSSGEQQGIIGTVQIGVQGQRATMASGYYSKCGEFYSGWMKISPKGAFSFKHQWKNGFGLMVSAQMSRSASNVSGHIRSWGGGCNTGTLSFTVHKIQTTV